MEISWKVPSSQPLWQLQFPGEVRYHVAPAGGTGEGIQRPLLEEMMGNIWGRRCGDHQGHRVNSLQFLMEEKWREGFLPLL